MKSIRRTAISTIRTENLSVVGAKTFEEKNPPYDSLRIRGQHFTSENASNYLGCSLCLVDEPGPPVKVEAIKITIVSIKVRWTAPKDTGRSKILAYRLLTKHPNGIWRARYNITTTANTLLEYTFNNLQKDTSYQISVSAYNKAGEGGVTKATFKTLKGKMADTRYGTSISNPVGGGYLGEKQRERVSARINMS